MGPKSRLLLASALAATALFPTLAGAATPAPPETMITSGPEGLVHAADVAFGFASGDAAAEFECRLDGGVWTPRARRHVFDESWHPCAPPERYRHMEGGPHLFEVRAVDADGLRDPTPAAREFEIDTNVAGYVAAKRVQRQTPERIRINVRLSAAEPVEAELGGWIALDPSSGGPVERFELTPLSIGLSEGDRRRLRLVPETGRRRILRALRKGQRGRARLSVRFTNEHGNTGAYRVPIVIAGMTSDASAESRWDFGDGSEADR